METINGSFWMTNSDSILPRNFYNIEKGITTVDKDGMDKTYLWLQKLRGGYIPEHFKCNSTIANGVTIFYSTQGGQVLSSTQVGKLYEYQPGPATVIATGPNVTRIQPNAVCPAR